MCRIVIIAGPNGAGKTTFGLQYREVEDDLRDAVFLNADEIARSLPAGVQGRDLAAGREMIRRIDELVAKRANFMVETTLATRWYAQRIPVWRTAGYRVDLIYLRLPDADYAVRRVARRVEAGGHDIPEQTVRRRFDQSLDFLTTLYAPLVDEVVIHDNEDDGKDLTLTENPDG